MAAILRPLVLPCTAEQFRALMQRLIGRYDEVKGTDQEDMSLVLEERVDPELIGSVDWSVQCWAKTVGSPAGSATISAIGEAPRPRPSTLVSFFDGWWPARWGGADMPIGEPFLQLYRDVMQMAVEVFGVDATEVRRQQHPKRMEEFAWTIPADADMFEDRIRFFLERVQCQIFRLREGAVQVLGMRVGAVSEFRRELELMGNSWPLSPGQNEWADLCVLIRFTVVSNTSDQVDVVVECVEPALSHLFEMVKGELQRIWPQPRAHAQEPPEPSKPKGKDLNQWFVYYYLVPHH